MVTVKCVATIYDIYYKVVETRILKDKRNRRIIKMDKDKVKNNKYTYIVDKDDSSRGKASLIFVSQFSEKGSNDRKQTRVILRLMLQQSK